MWPGGGRGAGHGAGRGGLEIDLTSNDERTGRRLQRATIIWNSLEVGITVWLVAFVLDSLIEVFASLVVLWHMRHLDRTGAADRGALRLVGLAFALLAGYLIVRATRALWIGDQPSSSPLGIAYMSVTALVMFGLAR